MFVWGRRGRISDHELRFSSSGPSRISGDSTLYFLRLHFCQRLLELKTHESYFLADRENHRGRVRDPWATQKKMEIYTGDPEFKTVEREIKIVAPSRSEQIRKTQTRPLRAFFI